MWRTVHIIDSSCIIHVKKNIHSSWKIHATCQKRALAGNIANIILGSNTFEKMRGRSILFSFYFFISVWISMSPNNPIKVWSLNHYRLGRMLINNSCSWVSYFDKYRTDKKTPDPWVHLLSYCPNDPGRTKISQKETVIKLLQSCQLSTNCQHCSA